MIVAFTLWEVSVLRAEGVFLGLGKDTFVVRSPGASGASEKWTQAPQVVRSRVLWPASHDLSAFPLAEIWGHPQVY